MVAPTGDAPRRKWRFRCSTCGTAFRSPQLWAYCSKDCERNRRGQDRGDSEDGTDEWLEVNHIRRMDLRDRLAVAMPWERVGLQRQIEELEAQEVAVRAELSAIDAPRDSATFWIQRLRPHNDRWDAWGLRGLALALAFGKRLVEAKESLPHGEFGKLFAEHEASVEGALTISTSWARKLMAIASNEAVLTAAKRSHANDLPKLPADVETVYLLSRVPASELEAAIERGDVTADMKRADARDLLPVDDEPEPSEPVDHVGRALAPVRRALDRFIGEHRDLLPDLKARLCAMLRVLGDEEVA